MNIYFLQLTQHLLLINNLLIIYSYKNEMQINPKKTKDNL